ncbi:M23 family metallopeptidase [Rothia nasisuis]|uniref:M23 family metallopeptidase n=2 Tax=Rothia nasisuis TaxID=2109647 RepID=UPI001F18E52C|nr:peptidoglycan DD-metalloendopeptidase family protein [Rothia nasisuis]
MPSIHTAAPMTVPRWVPISLLHTGLWWGLLCTLICLSLSTSPTADAVSSSALWKAPVGQNLEVLRPFEQPAAKWSAGHRGVDLALEAGGSVLAPYEGEVVFAGTVVDRQVMTVQHPDGRLSSFEPVTDPLPVGTHVVAGDVLAHLDPAVQHCTSEHCLHWGVRQPTGGSTGTAGKGFDYINPLLLLGLEGPSVLLPIGDDFAA